LRQRIQFGADRAKPLLRYGRFLILKMATIRHIVFVVRLLWPPTKRSWRSLSLCKIWLESAL